jgi:hypothetical protein
MLTKMLMSAVLVLGVSSVAMAQTTPATPSTAAPGAATSGKLTEAQIKQKLAQQGYSDIQLRPASAGSGSSTAPSAAAGKAPTTGNEMWTGTAMKGGKKVRIEVDANGKATETM